MLPGARASARVRGGRLGSIRSPAAGVERRVACPLAVVDRLLLAGARLAARWAARGRAVGSGGDDRPAGGIRHAAAYRVESLTRLGGGRVGPRAPAAAVDPAASAYSLTIKLSRVLNPPIALNPYFYFLYIRVEGDSAPSPPRTCSRLFPKRVKA